MRHSNPSPRFQIALSFPGKYRAQVERVAQELADRLGRTSVLYDLWYRAEFARPNLDVYLMNLYREHSLLLVFFLCKDYSEREWCGLEWRVGRELVKKKEDDRLLFLRLDDADIPGLYSLDGYLDISKMPADEVAREILTRLAMLTFVPPLDIDKMVRDLRTKTYGDIQNRCGTIRILTMEQPVALAGVYTDVNVLDQRTANRRQTREELVKEATGDAFDSFGIVTARTRRVRGIEAVEKHRCIMIYGRPGAGKTTFLKRLATECAAGRYRSELVPAFVTLRDYAEADSHPSLATFIEQQWFGDTRSATVLTHGRAFLLLDGLDEVRDRDFDRVRKAIEDLRAEFYRCPVVLSCRIAAREYAFESFAEVEMADFNQAQIEEFAARWFASQQEPKKADLFTARLTASRPLSELASSPLLLMLLCLVFQERGDFDGTRAQLYREGIDILLRKWDAKRGIERDRPYDLSITDMELLLTEIAYRRFSDSEYFFDQDSLEKQIEVFFESRNLIERREFRPDRILNSIESHLGLLVQRAVRVYSFSHLTFQEFLTAQRVAKKKSLVSEVGLRVGERRWREIWLLLVTMIDPDEIIPELKYFIDMMVADEAKILRYLEVCRTAAAARHYGLRPSVLRAVFLEIGLAVNLGRALEFDLARALSRPPRLFDTQSARHKGLVLDLAIANILVRAGSPTHDWTRTSVPDLKRAVLLAREFRDAVGADCRRAISAAKTITPKLANDLVALRNKLPKKPDLAWWRTSWPHWCVELCDIALASRGFGEHLALTVSQVKVFNEYYNANCLLVDCIRAARGITNETRRAVEDTLLLPGNKTSP